MKTEITQDELEKIKVLNLLMWLQASIYAGDECEDIKWFYNHQTKMTFISGFINHSEIADGISCAHWR